uniref:PPM-type phosphatase domain-containing protein n=1 Tax=Anopheles culicifacies TaxID=139723 RepID=A0A182LSQ2_9DIPT
MPSTAGTTASIAFIRRGKIYIGHVGDSGIVLGYQNDKESAHDGRWVATPLTEDHKPESYAEKMRIMSCGGKVVTKSGVPRVVWNRPRIGHKGPVRRSTPIDEIPFLAVARSLGDLWSYNSAMDEFVVSPVPDVSVIEIDPKKYRCLIFGTDGLWNVMSPKNAVDIVRNAEMENIRIALEGGNEWKNPSKLLVNEALDRWSRSNMKADNTSVVIIMLDPPGPPKRDVLKSVKDSIQHVASDQLAAGQSAVGSNIIHLFDCITRGESLPTISEIDNIRYSSSTHHHSLQSQHNYQHAHHNAEEEYCDSEGHETNPHAVHQQPEQQQHHHHQHQMAHLQASVEQYSHALPSTSYQDQDLSYTDSFAESYNTLLNRSFENTDHSYTSLFHPGTEHGLDAEDVAESYRSKATMVEGMPHEEDDETMYDYSTISSDDETIVTNQSQDSTYSLTNLQTKSERLRAEMLESCSSPDTYYHHHQQHHPEESTAYSTGNLAIIEHFHNYHHPPPPQGYETPNRSLDSTREHSQSTEDVPAEAESIGGAMRSLTHHNYHQYQMEMDESYHHQQQPEQQQHHTDSNYQDYQIERYDYRNHPGNNNGTVIVPCEATCSKYVSKSDHRNDPHVTTGDTSEIGGDEEEEEEAEEEMKDASPSMAPAPHPHQIISINGHRIQINEVSSSFVGSGACSATKVLLAHSNTESTSTDTAGYSGDEENSASSTTTSTTKGVKQMVVPVLMKQRSRKPGPSTRVITIFYETRSSRRQSRARNQPSSSFIECGRKRTELKPSSPSFGGIVKRRKTTTVMRAAQHTIEHEKVAPADDRRTADTFVRRALRSNGVVNAARQMLTGSNSTVATVRTPMQTCHDRQRRSTGGGLVSNEFGVSTTTPNRCLALQTAAEKERSHLSRTGCNTRRMRLDEQQQQQQLALELLDGSKRAKQLRRAQ